MNRNIYLGAAALLFAVSAVLGAYLLFFINQTAILPIDQCRSMFIFTPDSAETCSEIHMADAVLAQFGSPLIYIFLLTVTLLILAVVKAIKGK